MLVCNMNGVSLDYDNAVNYMDDELCEQLYDELAPCSEQQFFTAYEQAHLDKFGEVWEFSKFNPQI